MSLKIYRSGFLLLQIVILVSTAISCPVLAAEGDVPETMAFSHGYVQTLHTMENAISANHAKPAPQTSGGYIWHAEKLPDPGLNAVVICKKTLSIESGASLAGHSNLKDADYTYHLYGGNAGGGLMAVKEYELLDTLLMRIFLVLLGMGGLTLCVWFFVSRRTKTITRQRQKYKEITGQAISVVAAITDSKNEHTAGHSRRVARYSVMLGRRLGLSEDELEVLRYAALLHDIGKISIPDSILNKKTSLTNEEYEIVKAHVAAGVEMLNEITIIEDIALGAKYHHEKVDGTGYSEGLRGDEIPLFARIISVTNAFDAMLSERPYRKALSVKETKFEFVHNAGTQFDERIAAILIEMIDEGEIPI